jgi:hypothetical protein
MFDAFMPPQIGSFCSAVGALWDVACVFDPSMNSLLVFPKRFAMRVELRTQFAGVVGVFVLRVITGRCVST